MIVNILPYKNELYRKLIHLLSIVFPISYYYCRDVYFTYIILTFTLILIILDIVRIITHLLKTIYNKFLGSVTRNYEDVNILSGTYMMISFCIITVLFNKPIVISSMIILIISDSLAAVFGIKYGKIILINKKTLEGSFVFFSLTILFIVWVVQLQSFS